MVTVAKYPTYGKIQDGGSRRLECSIFGHSSGVNEDIFVNFDTLTDIGQVSVTVAQYPTFGKIQDGVCPNLGFVFLQHIVVTVEDIYLKFGT